MGSTKPTKKGSKTTAKIAGDGTTATASPADVGRRILEALNARDLDAVGDLQHDDVVDDFVAVGVARGKAEVRRFFEDLLGAVPDFAIRIQRITSSGDVAVVEWLAEGTFTGTPFQGIEATGRRVSLRGVDCMRVEDGRLRHNVIYYDGAGFARDLGLLPSMGSLAERGMKAAFNAVTRIKRILGH